jgi:hypothetical protein
MGIGSFTKLLGNLPSLFNKRLVVEPSALIDIRLPLAGLSEYTTVGTTELIQGSCNNAKLIGASAFSIDRMFSDIQTVKDITYIGQVPVDLSVPGALLGSTEVSLFGPQHFTTDASGNIYVEGSGGCAQYAVAGGAPLATYSVSGVTGGIALDAADNVWVTQSQYSAIRVFQNDGTPITSITDFALTNPTGIKYCPINDCVYAINSTGELRVYGASDYLYKFSVTPPSGVVFRDLAFDTDGALFITALSGTVYVYNYLDGAYITEFASEFSVYDALEVLNSAEVLDPDYQSYSYVLAYSTATNAVDVFCYTPVATPATLVPTSFVKQAKSFSPSGVSSTSLGVSISGSLMALDTTNRLVMFFSQNVISNRILLFSGYLEDNSLPGFVYNVTQTQQSNFNYEIPEPIPNTGAIPAPRYVTIRNTGSYSFFCENVLILPGSVQVYTWAPGGYAGYTTPFGTYTQNWIPTKIKDFDTVLGSLVTENPLNAVYVPGPTLPGYQSPDLDPLGESFGIHRIIREDDITYKKRIAQSVTGSKMTPQAIKGQFKIIYGIDVEVFQWYPSSYAELVTYLGTLAAYQPFYLDGTAFTVPGSAIYYHTTPSTVITCTPLDLSASQGPPNTFYVVIHTGSANLINGVYPNSDSDTQTGTLDWSFIDYGDTEIGAGRHGGFFIPNTGETGYSLTSGTQRYLHLISSIKAAGTDAIVILTQ